MAHRLWKVTLQHYHKKDEMETTLTFVGVYDVATSVEWFTKNRLPGMRAKFGRQTTIVKIEACGEADSVMPATFEIEDEVFKVSGSSTLMTLGLSTRVINVMETVGVKTLNQLCSHDADWLNSLHGLGVTSHEEIELVLKKVGRSLGDYQPEADASTPESEA